MTSYTNDGLAGFALEMPSYTNDVLAECHRSWEMKSYIKSTMSRISGNDVLYRVFHNNLFLGTFIYQHLPKILKKKLFSQIAFPKQFSWIQNIFSDSFKSSRGNLEMKIVFKIIRGLQKKHDFKGIPGNSYEISWGSP